MTKSLTLFLQQIGADALTEKEIEKRIAAWRAANPGVAEFWRNRPDATPRTHALPPPLLGRFNCRGDYVFPDGTVLPAKTPNRFLKDEPK